MGLIWMGGSTVAKNCLAARLRRDYFGSLGIND